MTSHFRPSRPVGLGLAAALVAPLLPACPSDTPREDEGGSATSGITTMTASAGTDGETSGPTSSGSGEGTDASAGTEGSATTSASSNSNTNADGPDGSGSDWGSTTMDMNCGEQMFMVEAIPPNVMIVLDKSGSMVSNDWDDDNDPMTPDVTRWFTLYGVVDNVVNSFDDQINFGAVLFPSTDAIAQLGAGACPVEAVPEVPVAPMNGGAIVAALPDQNSQVGDIIGATPAAAGIQTAMDHLMTLDPNVDRFMILITDGAANCSEDADLANCPGLGCELMVLYDQNLQLIVEEAYTMYDIPTFVVGVDIINALTGVGNDGAPEANTYDELNEVAMLGGVPQPGPDAFYDAQNQMELDDALTAIAGTVFNCTVPLDPPAQFPDFVVIEINGMVIPKIDDCATEDGWTWVNPMGPYDAVELCGTACDTLADNGMLEATFGCPPPG
jgi:hypothetical protein